MLTKRRPAILAPLVLCAAAIGLAIASLELDRLEPCEELLCEIAPENLVEPSANVEFVTGSVLTYDVDDLAKLR